MKMPAWKSTLLGTLNPAIRSRAQAMTWSAVRSADSFDSSSSLPAAGGAMDDDHVYVPLQDVVTLVDGERIVDAHVHLGEEVMRGLVPDDAPPDEWLPRWLLPAYAALTPDDERLSAELGIAQMLLTGTTTFCEAGTLLDWQAAADAVSETGTRVPSLQTRTVS